MTVENGIRLFLVRHGNTFEADQVPTQVGSRTDLPLTEMGKQQALYFSKYLASEHITPSAIYAGSLKRQLETAHIIGNELHCEETIHSHLEALTEIDYGPWEGLTAEEIQQKWPTEYAAWTTKAEWPPFFGKSKEEHIEKMKEWIHTLRTNYKAGDVVLGVTSNGIIRFFYSLEESDWQKLVRVHEVDDLKVKTGHFCELVVGPDAISVKWWNSNPKDFID